MPVVSSTSPPDSHGVGSASSEMCTHRTGASRSASPASSATSRSAISSRTGQHAAHAVHIAQASSRTGRRTASISSNCSGPAISGGASWITGSPRSSARQISPAYRARRRGSRAAASRPPRRVKGSLGLAVLDQLDRLEVAGAAHVADDRDVAQRLEHPAERPRCSRTFSRIPSSSKTSRLAIATAARDGWPPKVKPCMNDVVPSQERLDDPVGGDHRAHRRVGRGDALGRGDDVRLVAERSAPKYSPRRPKEQMTSSEISSTSYWSQISRTRWK